MAQMCLKLDDTPNCLFVINNNKGTINPSKGPEIYQGQDCVRKFMLVNYVSAIYLLSYKRQIPVLSSFIKNDLGVWNRIKKGRHLPAFFRHAKML